LLRKGKFNFLASSNAVLLNLSSISSISLNRSVSSPKFSQFMAHLAEISVKFNFGIFANQTQVNWKCLCWVNVQYNTNPAQVIFLSQIVFFHAFLPARQWHFLGLCPTTQHNTFQADYRSVKN